MKYTGIELEREDIITLFSDGTYGTDLCISARADDMEEWKNFKEEEKDKGINCIEDFWADWLLSGHTLVLDGNECDEEDEDYDTDLVGEFDLERFNGMMNKALNDKDMSRYVQDLMNEDDDMITGYCLLQYIAYGEVILG